MQENMAFIFWCVWVTMNQRSTTRGLKTATMQLLPLIYSKGSRVFIITIIISISCKKEMCLFIFVNCRV